MLSLAQCEGAKTVQVRERSRIKKRCTRTLEKLTQSSKHCSVSEDDELAAGLLASLKDRAEHVMLVDLARNDVNRVCQPQTVKVDSLMQVEKFSHVMHLTSQVSGLLREGLTR